jgi:hypothetical protein
MTICFEDVGPLIDECRSQGIVFTLGGVGFKCKAPTGVMTSDVKSILGAFGDNIRQWLIEESELAHRTPSTSVEVQYKSEHQWTKDVAAAADFVLLLTIEDLPEPPFELSPGRTVIDRCKFLRSIQDDIKAGIDGARSKTGALQVALSCLKLYLLAWNVD